MYNKVKCGQQRRAKEVTKKIMTSTKTEFDRLRERERERERERL